LIFFKKDKIQSGLSKRENNSDSELNLENELNKNMQKIINGNLSPTFGPTTQKFFLNNNQQQQYSMNKVQQQQQSSLTSSQFNDYYKLNNLNETSMPMEMMMTIMSLNNEIDDKMIKKSYSREMTPDSIDSSLTSSMNGSVADIIKNKQNILDSHYFKSSSVEELIPTKTVPLQFNQNHLHQQLLLLQQQQQQQQVPPPATMLLQQQLYYQQFQQLQQLLIKQQQLLQLQQLQSQTVNTQEPIIQQKSQIPVPVVSKPNQEPEEQTNDENGYRKIKRYPEILNTKSAAGIGKRLAYALSTDVDDNSQQVVQDYESKIVKIEEDHCMKIKPKLEEINNEDENKKKEFKLKNKKSDFIYKKPNDSTSNKPNFEYLRRL
jgi:hypothetical protein